MGELLIQSATFFVYICFVCSGVKIIINCRLIYRLGIEIYLITKTF